MGPLAPAVGRRHEGCSARAHRAVVAGLLVGTFLLAVLSVVFAPEGSEVESWWPAAAVGVTLLLVGRRWRVLVPSLWVVTGLANLAAGREPAVAAAFGACNALEAVVVAALLTGGRRRPPRLEDLRDGVRLLGAALAGAAVLGLGAGSVVALLADGSLWPAARSTVASHSASMLVVLPVVLLTVFATPSQRAAPPPRRLYEWALQASLLTVVVAVAFAPGQHWPLAFAVFPPLVWAALRLPPRVATAEVVVVAVAVSILTAEGAGPFGALLPTSSPAEVGALVQVFLAVVVLVTLPLALVTDERRRTLRALAEESALTDAVVDSEAALVMVVDDQRRVVRANATAVRLARSGCEPGEPVWRSGLLGDDDAAVHSLLDRTCVLGHRVETTLRHPGSPTTLLWSGRTAELAGRAPHHVLTALDVTGHRSTEELLRRFMSATTGTVLVGMDLHHRITLWNAGAEQLLGWSAGDVVGTPVADLVAHHDGPTPPVASGDWELVCRDGSVRAVHVVLDVTTAPTGEPVGHVAVGQDVTVRRTAERRLTRALARERESAERLAEASRIRSDLVASVSHELRTPLTNVLGFTQLLRRAPDELDARRSRWVDRIEDNGRQLLTLIEDLLLMARVETVSTSEEHDEVDLSALVVDTVEQVRRLSVSDPAVLGRPGGSPGLATDVAPGVVVRGDARQLERAVRNLVVNAVRFSPRGGQIRVGLRLADEGVELRVRDEGIGIAPEELESVFQPFVRGRAAQTEGIGGTGLGLGIVRAVAEAHGGRVRADSRTGGGTTMTWWMPVAGATGGDGVAQARCMDTVASRVSAPNGLTR